MADEINWAKLVQEGRAKAMGVSWTDEELKALYELKIPADYVRQGILTQEDYEKELGLEKSPEIKGKTVPLVKLRKDELLKKAKELDIEIADEKAITKGDLILLIQGKK